MTAPEPLASCFRTPQSCGSQPIPDVVGDLVANLRQGDASPAGAEAYAQGSKGEVKPSREVPCAAPFST
jgi:hypothetical protein